MSAIDFYIYNIKKINLSVRSLHDVTTRFVWRHPIGSEDDEGEKAIVHCKKRYFIVDLQLVIGSEMLQ